MIRATSVSIGKSFIVKLHKILRENKYQNTISWSEDGFSVLIKSIPLMMEKVLPDIYKHRNYSSFVRQLNTYGFNKIPNQEGQHIYYHKQFNKHQQVDYSLIIRKQAHREPTTPLHSKLKEIIKNFQQRIVDLEQRMSKKETEMQKLAVQRLLFLQKLTFQLQQKLNQQQKLISILSCQSFQSSINQTFKSRIFKPQQLLILNKQILFENKLELQNPPTISLHSKQTRSDNIASTLILRSEPQILDEGQFLLNKESQIFYSP